MIHTLKIRSQLNFSTPIIWFQTMSTRVFVGLTYPGYTYLGTRGETQFENPNRDS